MNNVGNIVFQIVFHGAAPVLISCDPFGFCEFPVRSAFKSFNPIDYHFIVEGFHDIKICTQIKRVFRNTLLPNSRDHNKRRFLEICIIFHLFHYA